MWKAVLSGVRRAAGKPRRVPMCGRLGRGAHCSEQLGVRNGASLSELHTHQGQLPLHLLSAAAHEAGAPPRKCPGTEPY